MTVANHASTRQRWPRALLVACTVFALVVPGRHPTVQDVVMDTIGAAVGGGAVLLVRLLRRG